MRYNIGDRVRVIYLEPGVSYGNPMYEVPLNTNPTMRDLSNQVVTIVEIAREVKGAYTIQEDNGWFYWNDSMFAGKVNGNRYKVKGGF